MNSLRVLRSEQDLSVNFVEQALAGFLESRYVRRTPERFVCYLSSHTGCNRGCGFCHLTVTGQTSFQPTTINDYVAQALHVFKHYRRQEPAKYMHYAFMARGEPMANPHLVERGEELLVRLGQLARDEGLPAKFAVSTILPLTLKRTLSDVFGFVSPTIYYSAYSAREEFRGKWMPTALPFEEALRLLKDYQEFSKKIVKIHHALIAGENDSVEDAEEICAACERYRLVCEFNLVRYNPASPSQGREADDEAIARYVGTMARRLGRAKVVQRVGYDVKASCGMFDS